MNENLINSTFSYEFSESESFSLIIFSGESRDPALVGQRIREYISELRERGLSRDDFEVARRMVYGDTVSSFNSVYSVAMTLIDCAFSDRNCYEYIDAVANVTFEDVCRRFDSVLNVDKSVLSAVLPRED